MLSNKLLTTFAKNIVMGAANGFKNTWDKEISHRSEKRTAVEFARRNGIDSLWAEKNFDVVCKDLLDKDGKLAVTTQPAESYYNREGVYCTPTSDLSVKPNEDGKFELTIFI